MRKYRDRAKKKNGNNTEWQNILTYSKGRQENGKRNLKTGGAKGKQLATHYF